MKKMNESLTSIKRLGLSAVAAGAILFAGGNAVSADEGSELGEELLYEGKTSVHVEELNELLSERGLLEEGNDVYTADTAAAVTDFQKEYDLMVDGLAGVQTAKALSELSHGDTGYLVEELQQDLNDLGKYNFDIDGIFGPITEEAVQELQAAYGLEQSGVATPETISALYDAVNAAPQAQENAADESAVAEAAEEEAAAEEAAAEEAAAEEAAAEEAAAEEAAAEEAAAEEAAAEEAAAEEAAAEEAAAEEAAAEEAAAEEAAAEEAAAEEAAAEEAAAEEAAAEEAAAEEAAAEEAAAEEAAAEEAAAEEAAAEEAAAEEAAAEEAAAEEAAAEEAAATSSSSGEAEGETLTVEATAYTANCTGCTGVTATGIDLNANPDQKVIAVDPNVIPLGSTVEVEGYGTAIAGDTGGAITGNKVDLYMQSHQEAINFGRQTINVTVVDTP
ncbi:peptidoglycan-binding protein [Bacillus daqingensis]|uniref:Peptidoglycan-binding protein n=1 Tax=Bacillus daqingensis TaxID=872396 RepID=A0ABV9P046_9BACI